MRIVYLSESVLPSRTANSIQVMRMCAAFRRNGHDVHLITPEAQSNNEDVFSYYDIEDRFEISRVPWMQVKGRKYIAAIAAALLARRLSPDLAFGRCLQSCVFAARLGIPVIWEAHVVPARAGRLTSYLLSDLLRSPQFRRLVVISSALGSAFEQRYGMEPDLITVAHDAADDPGFAEPHVLGQPGRLQVGYVGHLYPGKGLELLAPLAQQCAWADFHVIGGTEKDIAFWRRRTAGTQNLYFHGYVPHGKTPAYRQGCDVLLAPYQERVSTCGGGDISRWMSPLKIFEYMAAGRAIISSDLPVLRESLNADTALFCPPADVEAWVAALMRLRDDPGLRKRLGARARKKFLKRHTWSARAQFVLEDLEDSGGESDR